MRLENIQLRYRRKGPRVLAGVDARFEPGEVIVILGRNGAGKSTLLQVVAGVLSPTGGTVRDRPPHVAWVPERFPADQPFTVRGYLKCMARVRRLPAAGDAIDLWARRLGFARYLDERLSDLSKGTAQKVGLAQAMLRTPRLLVLDEPWEGLDTESHDEIQKIVREVADDGGIVVISDHGGLAAGLPDATSWLLQDGRLVEAAATVRATTAVPDGTPLWASPTLLTPTVSTGHEPSWVVEVAVSAADQDSAIARLRSCGHEVLRVRERVTP